MPPIRDGNPTTLKPVIAIALIICCVIVYALGVIAAVLFEGAILPEEIAWVTVETSCEL